ncbi:MAG: hypothetical protein CM15mP120_11910 [Pseudomonadota bacterium]|nr:MAG: hypothetical protein CM15mP120_11910 [Pseudomonadota bacterium]
MLFIGTGKYPEVDSFQQYITANGGSSTSLYRSGHTNYFFGIQNSAFNEGLDRFGHFFIDPLLSPEYVEREKNAVHSEYQMQIKDDGWRGYMVSKLALNPEHPGSRFTIGSLETLKGDVKADLMDFLLNLFCRSDGLGGPSQPKSGRVRGPGYAPLQPNTQQQHRPDYPTTQAFTDLQLPAVLTSRSLKDTYQLAFNFPILVPWTFIATNPKAI